MMIGRSHPHYLKSVRVAFIIESGCNIMILDYNKKGLS